MKEVIRKYTIRLLDTGTIFPISDSRWVSPVHYVTKKEGFAIVPTKNNELIPTTTVLGY